MTILQVPTAALDSLQNVSTAIETSASTMNAFDLALKGGWLMVVLLILLFLSIYVLIERTLVIRKARQEDATFMNRIKDYIHEGKVDAALSLCRKTDTPAARMVEKGISRLGRPMTDVTSAVENVGNIEIGKLDVIQLQIQCAGCKFCNIDRQEPCCFQA